MPDLRPYRRGARSDPPRLTVHRRAWTCSRKLATASNPQAKAKIARMRDGAFYGMVYGLLAPSRKERCEPKETAN